MIVQSAYQVASSRQSPRSSSRVLSPVLATENLSRPHCPRCGSALLIAEQSRFSAAGRIDHDWSCDHCGNEFGTSIRLRQR